MNIFAFQRNILCSPASRSRRWGWRFLCALVLGVGLILISPLSVFAQPAHAEYVSSTPAQNAILHQAPTTVSILFSEQVNPTGSTIQVFDVNGTQVTTTEAQVDRTNLKRMTVPMQANGSELYVVVWRTVSAVEGHHDSGSFRFFVNPSPMLSGMINGGMNKGGSMSPSSPSSSGWPVWVAILIGVLGLLIGGGGSFFLTRRTRKAQ
jgi:methionine-rich copper-binding protein CopC